MHDSKQLVFALEGGSVEKEPVPPSAKPGHCHAEAVPREEKVWVHVTCVDTFLVRSLATRHWLLEITAPVPRCPCHLSGRVRRCPSRNV